MELAAEGSDWPTYGFILTICSNDLAARDYAGWVRATSLCTGCAYVQLSVSSTATRSVSWGQIKHLFRTR